jgi:hypothetical protein
MNSGLKTNEMPLRLGSTDEDNAPSLKGRAVFTG